MPKQQGDAQAANAPRAPTRDTGYRPFNPKTGGFMKAGYRKLIDLYPDRDFAVRQGIYMELVKRDIEYALYLHEDMLRVAVPLQQLKQAKLIVQSLRHARKP